MINKDIPLKIYQKHEVKITSHAATKEDIDAVNSAAITFQVYSNTRRNAKETWLSSGDGDSGSEKSSQGVIKAYNGV